MTCCLTTSSHYPTNVDFSLMQSSGIHLRTISQEMMDTINYQIVFEYRLVSNIRRTSNISRTPTLGNFQLEFSPTISLAQPPIQDAPRVLTLECRLLTKCEVDPHGPSCRVAWDFDSPWITGPMTAHQSVVYVRHIILAPTANLCTLSAIVFFPIKAWIWRHLRRYIDGSAILVTVKGPLWPRWPKISPCVTTKIMWNKMAFR